MPACPPRSPGTRSKSCEPGDFTLATMPARWPRSATRTTRWICMWDRSTAFSSSRHGRRRRVSAMRHGRRTIANRPGEGPRVAPSRRRSPAKPANAAKPANPANPANPRTRRPPPAVRQQSAAAVDRLTLWSRSDALAIRTLRLPGWNDGAASRRRGATPRGGGCARGRDAGPVQDVDPHPRQPAARTREHPAAAGAARPE